MSHPSPRCAPGRGPRGRDFPALGEFCRAYLHQDYAAEHGSPEGAARAFAAEAPAEARAQLAREARRLRAELAPLPHPAARELWCDGLGSAWHPRTAETLDNLLAALSALG